jgi:hypothetical protein
METAVSAQVNWINPLVAQSEDDLADAISEGKPCFGILILSPFLGMVCHLAFCVDYPHLGNRNPGAMKLFFVLVLFLVSASFAGGDIMEFMANSRTNLATADGLY